MSNPLTPRITACLARIKAHEKAIEDGEPTEEHEKAICRLDKTYLDLCKSAHLLDQNNGRLLPIEQVIEMGKKLLDCMRRNWPPPFYDEQERERQYRDGERASVAPTEDEQRARDLYEAMAIDFANTLDKLGEANEST
jgi:hypothetical protein